MLQQTFQALEKSIIDENDACIDCAKSIVEVVCRLVIAELDSPVNPVRPQNTNPSFGEWVAAAVRVLKLGDVRNDRFQKLVSQHHKLTTALGDLRNDAGPVSHGREGFLDRLSIHHRRAAVISADALITFLHQAYLEIEPNILFTREPYERFSERNVVIDSHIVTNPPTNDEGMLEINILLPGSDEIKLGIEPSRLLYEIDRPAYVQAFNASREAAVQELKDALDEEENS